MSRSAAREPLIDALRALALLGVVVVNLQSYPTGPWGGPLGTLAPADSPVATAVFALIAWLLQGKAYPLLAFLFGYSQALALRRGHRAQAKRRLYRLGVLGLLHGALVFAGDVLTLYGLCGLVVLAQARAPLRQLMRRLWFWMGLALVAFGWSVVWGPGGSSAGSMPPIAYPQVVGVWEFVAMNSSAYVAYLVSGVVLFAPEIVMLMLAGLIAGRIGWLTRPRWRRAVARMARRTLLLGLALNALYAWAVTSPSGDGGDRMGLVGPIGWLLSAGIATALSRAWHAGPPAWCRALVPLGRYTLSLYVGVSVFGVLVLSGAGLAVPMATTQLALTGVLLWFGALLLAHVAAAAGRRGPLEAWMARA